MLLAMFLGFVKNVAAQGFSLFEMGQNTEQVQRNTEAEMGQNTDNEGRTTDTPSVLFQLLSASRILTFQYLGKYDDLEHGPTEAKSPCP